MFTPTIFEWYIGGIGKARFSGAVVPEAFLRTLTTLRRLSDQLAHAGVLKQPPATSDSGAVAPT